MTYRDNPWFPQVLLAEAQKLREQDYDLYLNVWEGQCLQILEGVVYAKELRAAQAETRICTVPWDRETPVNVWLDLGAGKSDKTSIWFGQRVAMQNRMLSYYENNMSDTLFYAKEMQSRAYTYDTIWLPHDAKAKKIGNKLTIEEQFRAHFPSATVRIVPKQHLADGINAARLVFPNTYFDEDECEEGLKSLRHYRYKVVDGQYSPTPMHDWASHGADAFRYMALTIKSGKHDKVGVMERLKAAKDNVREMARRSNIGSGGWMS
jgi:phage terminase large subunit